VKTSHRVFAAAALLLCAAFGPARAQEIDELSDTGGVEILIPPGRDLAREEQAAARAFDERRQKMVEDCEDNHGYEIDCKREADTEMRAEACSPAPGSSISGLLFK